MATAVLRRVLGVVLSVLLAALAVGGSAGTASAAAYRYWNYYHVKSGSYVFAKTGPSDYVPKDGSVEAYRYGTSTGTSNGITPRADLAKYSFGHICAGMKAAAGKKRVAVIIDYGVQSDAADGETPPAPRTACAVAPEKATGQQVVDAAAEVRTDNGMLCGIDGYPVRTCSVTVKSPGSTATGRQVAFSLPPKAQAALGQPAGAAQTSQEGGSVPWPLIGALAGVVVVGGGALALNRRRTA